jgi:hypothetical protein
MEQREQYHKIERALLSVEQLILDLEQLQGFEYSVKNLDILANHLVSVMNQITSEA